MSHYKSAVYLDQRHYLIGIPAVVFSSIVTSAIFATLQQESHLAIKIIVVVVSLTASVLAAVQTFYRAGERAALHGKYATSFSRLVREIEEYLAIGDKSEAKVKEFLADFNRRFSALVDEAPTGLESAHQAAKLQLKMESKEE